MDYKTEILKILRTFNRQIDEAQFEQYLFALGFESLQTMDLVLSIEERLGFEIPEEELNGSNLKSPKTILDLIERLKP